MVENEGYVCRRKKVGEVYEIECGVGKEGNEQTKILQCLLASEGKSVGGSVFSLGGQYGKQNTAITCFSEDEFKEEISKKLKVNKENIKLIENDE